MLTPHWIRRFAALEVELRAPDEHNHFQCYWKGISVGVCSPDDYVAIQEVANEGIPEAVVIAVAEWYHENEGF